ncbi:MAG: hypothetical protein U1B80_04400 [Anaerolineaceae bacterium]|nr:hypothetical protein [Anaerolineaceae bacterium]
MKCLLPFILIAALLASCLPVGNPGLTDSEMATRVAQILTEMPPPEGQTALPPPESTPTPVLEVISPPATETPTAEPTLAATEPSLTEAVPTATTEATAPAITASPTPTAQPTLNLPPTDPRNRLGQPSSTDPMEKPGQWMWPTGDDKFASVVFKEGSMHLTGLTPTAGWRMPLTQTAPNLYIEMTFRPTTCTGRDNYGIIFRVPVLRQPDQGYLFGVSCDGYFNLWKWDGLVEPDGKSTTLIAWKKNSAILPGSNQTNRLGVMTLGDRFVLYANGVQLGEVRDAAYPDGHFGVFVNARETDKFTIRVDEASYWLNPVP